MQQHVSAVHALSPRESCLFAKDILQATPKFTSQPHSLCTTCRLLGMLEVHPCLPQKSTVLEAAGREATFTQSNPATLLPDLQHQEEKSSLGLELAENRGFGNKDQKLKHLLQNPPPNLQNPPSNHQNPTSKPHLQTPAAGGRPFPPVPIPAALPSPRHAIRLVN